MKYSEALADKLVELGYTTVFFVSGGNIMHLIESFSKRFKMIPVLHEVSAVIATDYFNETRNSPLNKALALVTLGPGVTNCVSGIAAAYVDSREVLLIGGQVKSTDLKVGKDRQNGLQEIDGVSILESITKRSVILAEPLPLPAITEIISQSWNGRKGPVYLEICLDVQGRIYEENKSFVESDTPVNVEEDSLDVNNSIEEIIQNLSAAHRPLILVGGGLSRNLSSALQNFSSKRRIPVATSWNGADRFPACSPLYAGRPNMFGQRWSNIFLQQADFILVLGSSLNLQQTGFNIARFAKNASIAQLDIDPLSLLNSQLENLVGYECDVNSWLLKIIGRIEDNDWMLHAKDREEWILFLGEIRNQFPVVEDATFLEGQNNPFQIIYELSKLAPDNLSVVSCSSGGTYTSFMQTFQNKESQIVVSSKGMGSMGVGLAGAIGTAFATENEVWLFEGDGGFAQNMQELGTVRANDLNIKILVFSNQGYASIRSTQKKYFQGNYVGCDEETGLGLPKLDKLAAAFNIDYFPILAGQVDVQQLLSVMNQKGPLLVEIFVDVNQPYLPKIDSVLLPNGGMESNPLHDMTPKIPPSLIERFFRYI